MDGIEDKRINIIFIRIILGGSQCAWHYVQRLKANSKERTMRRVDFTNC